MTPTTAPIHRGRDAAAITIVVISLAVLAALAIRPGLAQAGGVISPDPTGGSSSPGDGSTGTGSGEPGASYSPIVVSEPPGGSGEPGGTVGVGSIEPDRSVGIGSYEPGGSYLPGEAGGSNEAQLGDGQMARGAGEIALTAALLVAGLGMMAILSLAAIAWSRLRRA